MPVSCMSVSECSDEAVGCDTLCYLWVFIHVGMVVQIDEIMPQRLTEDQPSDGSQSQADTKKRRTPGLEDH